MNPKIYFLVGVFVTTWFALGKCAPVGESTLQIPIFTKQSTNNPNPESESASSSVELGNGISTFPSYNDPEILGVFAPSRRNRVVSDRSQIRVPILTQSSLADLYNNVREPQRDVNMKTAEIEAEADSAGLSVTYTLLSESELGDYSDNESYEGGSLSQSESEEDDGGDGDIFIDCDSSNCGDSDDDGIPFEDMQQAVSQIDDDEQTMTLEDFDVMMSSMTNITKDMGDLVVCMELYKCRLTKNVTSTDSSKSSSSITLNKGEVFGKILECKIWIGTFRSLMEEKISQALMPFDKLNNLNNPIGGSTSTVAPTSGMQQLTTEDLDEDDDEELATSVLFASDLQYGITTQATLNEDSSLPEKAMSEHFSLEVGEVDVASEANDLKSSTLSFNEPPKNLLQNEDENVPENEQVILIIEQGTKDTAAPSNPKKNLFHPLLVFPILICSLISSCILGTAYNKYLGRSEDKSKILKVPRMAIFSDAPLKSILKTFPSVTEAKVHSMKKRGTEVV